MSLPTTFKIHPRHPPVSFDDLALRLEIDLLMGRRTNFVNRLRKALLSATQQHHHPIKQRRVQPSHF